MRGEHSAPAVTATDPSPSRPTGTWTIDPSGSSVSLTWPKHRLWTVTGRLHGTPGVVELHLEVDREASGPDRLVLRGRGVLERRAFGSARPFSTLTPQIQLDLAVWARPVEHPHLKEGRSTCTTSMPG